MGPDGPTSDPRTAQGSTSWSRRCRRSGSNQYDVIYPPAGAAAYRRDLSDVGTHLLETGHFPLETHGEEIADPIEAFLMKSGMATTLKLRARTFHPPTFIAGRPYRYL